jgi:hypothetical protein
MEAKKIIWGGGDREQRRGERKEREAVKSKKERGVGKRDCKGDCRWIWEDARRKEEEKGER